ncbi:MAG: hypothetical protein IPN22_10145 [Bacteroidetes bacterium]|nr:hypothetical protein [Bacteroidota bacterium]
MGRPPTRPKGFRDGFYIEIVNRGMSQTMKLRSDSREEMERNAAMYAAAKKHVNILGEHKKGIWVDQPQEEPAQRGRKKKVKPPVDEDVLDFELPDELSEADMKALEEGKAPKAPKGEKAPKAPKVKAEKAPKVKAGKAPKEKKAPKPAKAPKKAAKTTKPVKAKKEAAKKVAKPAPKNPKAVTKKPAPAKGKPKAKPVAKKKKK